MAQDKTRVVMGTATPGGGFPAYGWQNRAPQRAHG